MPGLLLLRRNSSISRLGNCKKNKSFLQNGMCQEKTRTDAFFFFIRACKSRDKTRMGRKRIRPAAATSLRSRQDLYYLTEVDALVSKEVSTVPKREKLPRGFGDSCLL